MKTSSPSRPTFYSVEITVESGPVTSRIFQTLAAARRYAKWCAGRWPTRILRGGPGGELVA